jgi:hypothetical protein
MAVIIWVRYLFQKVGLNVNRGQASSLLGIRMHLTFLKKPWVEQKTTAGLCL